MSEKYNAVAIITARGGSKRIPRKNIRMFCGHPIIWYSIQAALDSGCFGEIMVSTDDNEIANIAKEMGAKVPFMRSKKNSDDDSTTVDVLEEVLTEYKKKGKIFDFFCCLYPTAPFVSGGRLREGCEALVSSKADSVLPIVRFSYPVWRGLKVEDGRIKMWWPENYNKKSQDLPPVFHDAGQFYVMRTESLLKQKQLYAQNSIGLEIPESQCQDIDSDEDWKLAEMKYQLLNRKS
ncbi:MAG TPA: pseudaminic acid cytidylyltransferase [Candidatus Omnitrophota bacterium]|nr:pseudaminic acid cytidylyltransferase [Candidatus Omnitrophota bacterium]HPD84106.1 pseudaminic acid cytidylyltransferase [Candidatus Omnitrophota bacterium]HRZ02963.1 pseudaminic acid cytidylyltransferase [Candidatus Omnitrophota bacterium]